jgi:hypothetical protein
MNEYEIGRDFQELRSRIERLESVLGDHSPEARVRNSGISATQEVSGGVPRHHEPVHWKSEKGMQLPPFLHRLLGVPEGLTQYDLIPESKTWTCQPEPLILHVNWNAGGSDEFYRLQNQIFSIIRITDPNSLQVSCTATYSARLVASGRARSSPITAGRTPTQRSVSQFNLTLRDAQGGSLKGPIPSPHYSISCTDNHEFVHFFDFNPGLYDLVAGATWEISGAQVVDRC